MENTIISLHLYWLIVYGLVLYAVYELTTKSKAGTLLITVMPLFLLPLLLETEFNGWFNILKSFTMLFVLIYATVIRLAFKQSKARIFLGILLYLNIIEAIAKDIEVGNYFNVFTGCIVLIVLPLPNKLTLEKREDGDIAQAIYPMSWTSIIIYTLWHFCFMYSYQSGRGFQGDYVLLNVVLLLVPFLVAYFKGTKYWLQTRAYTLAINILLLEATITQHPEFWPLTPNWYIPSVYWALSGVAALASLGYLIHLMTKNPSQLSDTILGNITPSIDKKINTTPKFYK